MHPSLAFRHLSFKGRILQSDALEFDPRYINGLLPDPSVSVSSLVMPADPSVRVTIASITNDKNNEE